jgi:hypothetical protein
MSTSNSQSETRRRRLKALLTIVGIAAAVAPAALLTTRAAAAAAPSHVSFTLEGCRGSAGDFPASGPFICADALYTTGNLGGGWNELDLVPYRITASAGNSAPSSQTYTIGAAADNCIKSGTVTGDKCADGSDGFPGYDVISVPTLNTSLSSGSCTALSASPSGGAGGVLVPGLGGTDVSIYRLLTITQAANTTCVYDYYERLALGAHLFPGSSLHSNLTLPTYDSGGNFSGLTVSGIGSKDVPIPVNQIAPQTLSKSMSAVEGSDHTWNVTKTQTPATLVFSQSCNPSNPTSASVTVTINWTRSPADPSGPITVTTDITATNPSHRQIQVNVTDTVFSGITAVTALTGTNPFSTSFLADANTSTTVTHVITVAGGTGNLNDQAVATYTDLVTGIPVPGQTTATASAAVQFTGPTSNATAVITDVTSISGADLQYSIDSTSPSSFGSFVDNATSSPYVLGTATTDQVTWTSPSQSGSGSVQFNETVDLNAPAITSGTLTDTASLLGSDGFTATAPAASTAISADATVALTISKTIVGDVTTPQTFTFAVSGPGGYASTQSITVTPPAMTNSTTVSGLAPGAYTVTENLTPPWLPDHTSQSWTFTVTPGNIGSCSKTLAFTNSFGPAVASVQKVTVPAGQEAGWVFVLTGPGITTTVGTCPASVTVGECVTTTGTGAVPFSTSLIQGTYTVTEVGKPGWDETGVSLNGTAQAGPTCTFTVVYPADANMPFVCKFTNTERSAVKVVKTQSGQPLTGAEAFSFRLTGPGGYSNTQIANVGNGGTIVFGLSGGVPQLVPGSYTLCELALGPGWSTTLATLPGATTDPSTGNVCVGFTLAPGVFNPPFTFTIDNRPPPGGGQRTIGFWKNWSCQAPGHQTDKLSPLLPQQLGAFQVTGCAEAVTVLSNPSAKFAENQLAAQLLGAELNIAAGASTCTSVNAAIVQANMLLATVGYNPANAPTQLIGSGSQYRAQATSLATLLDSFNNGLVC